MRKGLFCRGVIYYAPTLIIIQFLSACSQRACEVGDIGINNKDVSLRKKVSEVYYPDSGKDYVALAQLINGYLSEDVLKSLGHKVDNAIFEAEAKRIDENTNAPETLKKIKNVYGSNRRAYIKTFIRIVYAERVLYNEVFLRSKDIHKEQYLKAEELHRKSISYPNAFLTISKDIGFKIRRLKISVKEGIIPYEKSGLKRAHTAVGIERAEKLINAVSMIREGDVYPDIIEWPEGYQVIRYIKKEKEYYIIDSVSIPKRGYDDWFWEKAGKVPVRIYDDKLKEEFLKNVSWAKMVKVL